MTLIRDAESRRTETPNGLMITAATPTQGGTEGLAVWRVEMTPGRTGPLHAFDTEQVWTFLDGEATVDLDGRELEAGAGDTVVLPAGVRRQITTGGTGFTAVVAAHAGCLAYDPDALVDETRCAIAPQGDERIVPPWAR
ncbi:cupin domain-containing protein [Actinomadura sp. NPDC048955]|uniref:Quercetin dioxygenase-like cupin family protein n=1 Tax=Actinomadura luteofluorescens TaxID=46163 RepID=A0A7Y9EMI0_9ACTN|nr:MULTISPECIES: cupin domain-containing protein [Actinomadura]MCR3742338.1 Cupin domain-containing protein [Actinomadura glauciflava]NYD50508.1 quercetin dioxygenase-like cupin family protein [Actinomadura luteofluorescens]